MRPITRTTIAARTLAMLLIVGCAVVATSTAMASPQRAGDPPQPDARQAAPVTDDGWLQAVIESAQKRTVKVYGAGAGRVNSYATGTIVSPDGHIITMQGVFLDGDQVRVAFPDGELLTASVLRRDRQYQMALLQVPRATPEYFQLSDAPVVSKGDWVVALSNAFMVAEREEAMSVTLGIVSLATSIEARLNRDVVAYQGDLILIDAITSNPGAGGGAVVSCEGELVGMIGKVINSSETNTRLNYAVPAAVIKQFVAGELRDDSAVRSTGERQQPSLGLELFRLGGTGGPAYVDRVARDGPAITAGFKPDDLIVTLAGEKIGSIRDYDRVLPTLTVGTEVVVVVKRGEELLRLTITPVPLQ